MGVVYLLTFFLQICLAGFDKKMSRFQTTFAGRAEHKRNVLLVYWHRGQAVLFGRQPVCCPIPFNALPLSQGDSRVGHSGKGCRGQAASYWREG